MRRAMQAIRCFLAEEDGPTSVEYAIQLALIVCIAAGAIDALGSKANGTFTKVSTAVKSSGS